MKLQNIETENGHNNRRRWVIHIGREEIQILVGLLRKGLESTPKTPATSITVQQMRAMLRDFTHWNNVEHFIAADDAASALLAMEVGRHNIRLAYQKKNWAKIGELPVECTHKQHKLPPSWEELEDGIYLNCCPNCRHKTELTIKNHQILETKKWHPKSASDPNLTLFPPAP